MRVWCYNIRCATGVAYQESDLKKFEPVCCITLERIPYGLISSFVQCVSHTVNTLINEKVIPTSLYQFFVTEEAPISIGDRVQGPVGIERADVVDGSYERSRCTCKFLSTILNCGLRPLPWKITITQKHK